MPKLTANGTTALGDALSLVFLMTDGAPTDDWRKGLNHFKTVRTGVVFACAAGRDVDTRILRNHRDRAATGHSGQFNYHSFFKMRVFRG